MVRNLQGQHYSNGWCNPNVTSFYCIFQIAGLLAIKLGLIAQHHTPECPVKKLDYALKVKVTTKVQNVSECLSGWYFLRVPIVSAQYFPNSSIIFYDFFFTKLSMVMYYHEAMCRAEKLVHYLQCQGHSEGLYDQNITIFTISFKLQVCLQPNLVC